MNAVFFNDGSRIPLSFANEMYLLEKNMQWSDVAVFCTAMHGGVEVIPFPQSRYPSFIEAVYGLQVFLLSR